MNFSATCRALAVSINGTDMIVHSTEPIHAMIARYLMGEHPHPHIGHLAKTLCLCHAQTNKQVYSVADGGIYVTRDVQSVTERGF